MHLLLFLLQVLIDTHPLVVLVEQFDSVIDLLVVVEEYVLLLQQLQQCLLNLEELVVLVLQFLLLLYLRV